VSDLRIEQRDSAAPVLVIGVGNPSRGDDALGPLVIRQLRERLRAMPASTRSAVELLDSTQLQPEHSLDLRDRRRTIIIDAAASGAAPYQHATVTPAATLDPSTHRLSPAALAELYRQLHGAAPKLETLAVRGYRFELGSPLSRAAKDNLTAALDWVVASAFDEGVDSPAEVED
jgi:hydrogenase maturation protease